MPDPIYLDNNATAPILPQVAQAMHDATLGYFGNPASQHQAGQLARRALEDARERVAALLGAKTAGLDTDRLIFTSGGTEANNLAIRGLLAGLTPGHCITSAIEHPSVAETFNALERSGWHVTRVRASADGQVDLERVAEAFRDDTLLVSIMAANNETGVRQPIEEIAALAADRGVPMHTDAVQWVGKDSLSFRQWNVSAMSFSAHKFHGPAGIGGVLVRHGVNIGPQLFGGHQQGAVRPGSESVALVVGLHAALEHWHENADARKMQISQVREEFEAQVCHGIADAVVIGRAAPRLSNTSCIAFPGVDRQALFLALDMAGVACSTGSACESGSSEPSPVLVSMGLPNEVIESALRFSFGAGHTLEEAQEAACRIIKAYKQLHR